MLFFDKLIDAFIIEDNKTEKYTLWSNKKLECRGTQKSYAGSDGVLVTLPKEYTGKDEYEILVTVKQMGNYFVSSEPLGLQTFKVRISDANQNPVEVNFSWKTIGYIK